jgi:1-deoxy-D-xylulose-5-phosphate reductoisomerase
MLSQFAPDKGAAPSAMDPASQPPEHSPRKVVVVGATGSIGRSAASVLEHDSGQHLAAFALAAHRNAAELADQARRLHPRYIALLDPDAAASANGCLNIPGTEFLIGPDAVERLIQHPEVDRVLVAIVGAAGLRSAWAALEAGKTLALANKETLVVAGNLIMDLARRRNADVLPVDSEHAAIHQCIKSGRASEIRRVILTSSGGPFRGMTRSQLARVTPDQALRHPTWNMGPKITIDSATLMNKALEIIEARWLFHLQPDQIEVVVHPESIVHSMVEFVDGSVIAQLSPPDMRLPIQYALLYPDRFPSPCNRLDLSRPLELHFEPPDLDTFPALELGFEVLRKGGTAGCVLNAANEAAVDRFLAGSLSFLDITRVCRAILDHHAFEANPSLDTLWNLDAWARTEVSRWT